MRPSGPFGIFGGCVVLPIALLGCATAPPPSGLARVPEEASPPIGQLDEAERAEVLATMRHAVELPGPAPEGAIVVGLRWPDDARAAARVAAATPGIEMAIVRADETVPDRIAFVLRGVRGEPGVLRVRRDGDRVTAEATVGRFPEDPADAARAAALVAEFDARLAAFAAKRKLR